MFIGIKYDDEFYEPSFFVKHRPNLKVEYYSAIGMQDLTIDDLEGNRKEEELVYREFVGDFYEDDLLDQLSFFIIPLMSLLILSGSAQLVGLIKSGSSLLKFVLGYLGNLVMVFTTFTVYWGLNIDGVSVIIAFWILSLASILLIDRKVKPIPQPKSK